jgi:serine protease Do
MKTGHRRIALVWLIPTFLLGIDLGLRIAEHRGRPVVAQVPVQKPVANQAASVGSGIAADPELVKSYAAFAPVNTIFQRVASTVSPSVVHIVARKKPGEGGVELEESGSGVVVTTRYPGQFVLTNNHVVMDAVPSDIRIHLSDGRVLIPEKVWADEKADIAIVRLSANAPQLKPAVMGDSDDVPVGTWVMALGSPFGLTHSVSHGIISARSRHEMGLFQDGVENQDFLQTDAAINPGNSGGPLVNLKGEVIGINTAIASQGGGSEGVGFTIPINLARWIMEQLLTHGRVNRGAMGVDLDDLNLEKATELGLELPRGALITGVHPDSPALRAGLREKDVILNFDTRDVTDLNHLINMVSMTPIGSPVELQIWRDRSKVKVRVTVGERDTILSRTIEETKPLPSGIRPRREAGAPADTFEGPWGLKVRTLDSSQARKIGLPGDTLGAMVLNVQRASPLATELQQGDVLTAINGKRFASADGLMEALRLAIEEVPGDKPVESGRGLEIEVIRSKPGQPIQVFVLKVDS